MTASRIDQATPPWIWRIVFLGTLLPLCWLWMMAVHELGHVLAAVATGGNVDRVVLHPLSISRTDVSPNPSPLVVAWAGAVVGVVAPLAAWLAFLGTRWRAVHLARFFAGFCLIANGAYLSVGSLGAIGDAGDLLRLGAPPWSLWAFGLVAVALGLRLWHGLGPSFGLGEPYRRGDAAAACASAILLAATLAIGFLLGPSV